jgi:Do/DeqQ family serine protease
MISRSLIAWLLYAIALPVPAAGQVAPMPPDGKPTLAPMLRRVTPAVVNIAASGTSSPERDVVLGDPAIRRFFDLPEPDPELGIPYETAGSGVIVDAANGYLLTNNHLVEDADEILVTLSDRRRVVATLIGTDAETDVAVLKIAAGGLTALELADSDALEVGDFVVAIGNPFGLGQTVTYGIVSALGRAGLGVERYEDFIQTDAAINPGSSGGALVDLDGKLVGINAAVLASFDGGNVGIGFAIPSNLASSVMTQIITYGEVRRGRLGVTIRDLTPDVGARPETAAGPGAVVADVEPGSGAARAGVESGDVIVTLNGTPVESASDLRNRIALQTPGDTVALGALRRGRGVELSVEIGTAQRSARRAVKRLEGAELEDLELDDPLLGAVEGVLVASVAVDTPAWHVGLRAGDVIVGANGRSIGTVDELEVTLKATADRAVTLRLFGDGAELDLR